MHITFDLLGRYADQRGDSAAIIAVPGEDDLNAFRGPEALRPTGGAQPRPQGVGKRHTAFRYISRSPSDR